MEGVASIFAVFSLTLQLIDTVNTIHKFLRSVQGAPGEILRLIDDLDQLQDYLHQAKLLAEQHQDSMDPPCSTAMLLKALKNCKSSVEGLANLVSTIESVGNHQSDLRRTWSAFKVISKKEDNQHCQIRVQDAITRLHRAITLNVAFLITEFVLLASITYASPNFLLAFTNV